MDTRDPFGFAKAINTKALDDLTPEQLAEVAKILDKVK